MKLRGCASLCHQATCLYLVQWSRMPGQQSKQAPNAPALAVRSAKDEDGTGAKAAQSTAYS